MTMNPEKQGQHAPPGDVVLVQTTVGERDEARAISEVLVGEKLCACAQVSGPVSSLYHWKGRVHDESEYLLTAKTTRLRYAALHDRLLQIHPYELPEIIATAAVEVNAAYADWVRQQCA